MRNGGNIKMLVFITILLLFLVITIINYVPVVYHYAKIKGYEKKLNKEINELSSLYSMCRIIITERLGEGSEPNNNTISFSQAHKNQGFSIKSTLELLNNF